MGNNEKRSQVRSFSFLGRTAAFRVGRHYASELEALEWAPAPCNSISVIANVLQDVVTKHVLASRGS